MVIYIKALYIEGRNMVVVNFSTLMEMCMKANGKMACSSEWVYINMQMVMFMKDIGMKARSMARVYWSSTMEIITKDNFKTMRSMARVLTKLRKVSSSLVNLLMV